MLPVDVTLLAAAHDLAVLFGRSLGIQNPVSFHAERNGVLICATKKSANTKNDASKLRHFCKNKVWFDTIFAGGGEY